MIFGEIPRNFHQNRWKNQRKLLENNDFSENSRKNAKKFYEILQIFSLSTGAKECQSCRSRKMLKYVNQKGRGGLFTKSRFFGSGKGQRDTSTTRAPRHHFCDAVTTRAPRHHHCDAVTAPAPMRPHLCDLYSCIPELLRLLHCDPRLLLVACMLLSEGRKPAALALDAPQEPAAA